MVKKVILRNHPAKDRQMNRIDSGRRFSFDELTVNKTQPCGTNLSFTYDLDPAFKNRYVKQANQSMPSGLTRSVITSRSCAYTDSDQNPDRITESVSVNGKTRQLWYMIFSGQIRPSHPPRKEP